MRWKDGVSANTHIECTIARFLKTMCLVAMGGIDCDVVTAILQGQCDVNDQSLCTTNAKVGVDNDHI